MNKKLRKIISLALTFVMLFTMLPMDVLADLITTDYSGGFTVRSIIPTPTDPPVYTRTYEFKVDGTTEDTQIVKNGEYLTEPNAPEKDGYRFEGWFVGEEPLLFGADNPITFEESGIFEATAHFEQIYYVFFMESADAGASVFRTKSGITEAQISTGDVKLPIGSAQAVTGWFKDVALTDGPVGANFTIGNSNQQLWPKIEAGNYMYFVSGPQATYIEPKFVSPTGVTQAPQAPVRPGYTFRHWSLTENGSAYTFGHPLTSDITLYAVWQANTNTSYTVVFWKQSINDDKNALDSAKTYDYAESVVRTGVTGATVSPTGADGSKNYQGFHYNSAKSTPVVIKGDGSTILNVYYDRNLLTIYFRESSSGTPLFRTFTGLYGQTLAKYGYVWPSESRWTQNSSTWNPGGTLTFLDSFIFDDITHYGSSTAITVYRKPLSGSAQIIHYKEALDGTWVEANTITTSGNGSFSFTNKYTGFTVYQYRADNGTWRSASPGGSASYNNLLEVRHKRNSYNLAFYNYNATSRTETLLYETSLSSFYNYIPPKPVGMPNEYEFKGWFKDKTLTEPFNFTTETMPAASLMIYAKWSAPVVNATIHLSMETGSSTIEFPLVYNEPLDPSILPTVKDSNGNTVWEGDPSTFITMPANHEWIGWSTKVNGDYISYNFNTVLTQNIELYPYYISNEIFTVTYNPGAGTGAVTDSKVYSEGAYADIMPGAGITPPTGQVFLGWTLNGDTSGKIYVANDRILIDGNKAFTAVFGPKLQTSITYEPNGGSGSAHTETLNNNATHKIIANPFTRTGYQFIGWNTSFDGTGVTYKPGQNVIVDGDSNILYAKWEQLIPITATKLWSLPAPDIAKPAVWFTLYRDGIKVENSTRQVPSEGESKVTWENMPQTDVNDGHSYEYTVKETDSSGADYTPPSFTKTENGLTVTNKYEYIDFTVTKVWAGAYLPETKPEIQLQLQVSANGGEFVNTGEIVTLTTATTHTWYNLPKQSAAKENLSYRAIEPTVPASYVATYEHTETSTTITNTYKTRSFYVTKNWDDPNNMMQAPYMWPAIELQLFRDGVAYGPLVLVPEQPKSQNVYEDYWEGLPEFKEGGTDENSLEKHVYTVRERYIPKNYVMLVTDTAERSTIENSLRSDSLIGTKQWQGEPPPDGASVTLQLYQTIEGTAYPDYRVAWGQPVEVTAASNWQNTWVGMPAQGTYNGQDVVYEYEIAEVSPPAGYYHDATTSASLYVTNVSEKISFTATKQWSGGINNRPDYVTLYLERSSDGGTSWEKVAGSDYNLLATEANEHTWTGLDHYHTWHATDASQRVKYIYRVREEAVANYATNYIDNNTIKNEYVVPLRTVSVTKNWDGGPSADHVLPTIRLYCRYKDDTVTEVTNQYTPTVSPDPALGNSGSFTVTYSNLPSTDADGNTLLYGFTEDAVTGYTTTFNNPVYLGGVLYALPDSAITNTYEIPMTAELTATKQWVNGSSADHSRVKLTLWRTTDGAVMEKVEQAPGSVTPPGGTSEIFVGSWSALAATDFNGNHYTYYFTEEDADIPTNYERSYTDYIEVGGKQYAKSGATVKNTYVPPTDATATATKQWVNGKLSQHEPVALSLYRSTDNGATMEEVMGASPTVTDTGSIITYEWSNLQRTDTNGVSYQFYFKEDTTALPIGYALSYSASVTSGGTEYAPNGATAYNTYTSPKIDELTAKKIWENGPKIDHKPVTLTLYRKIDGGVLQPVEASYSVSLPVENGNNTEFTYTWNDLDETDINGNAYTYYFKEEIVTGYSRTYASPYETDYGLVGTTVTNTYIQPTGTVEGTKRWVFVHKDALPDVWMKLYRSTDVSGAGMEAVPDIDTILVNSSTPMVEDPNTLGTYVASFSWDNIHQKNPTGEPYYFFVKEVDAAGNDYTPQHFEKLEMRTNVQNTYVIKPTAYYTPPTVMKVLSGRELQVEEFEFEEVQTFTDQQGTTEIVIEKVKNAADGKVTFSPIPLSAMALFYTPTGYIREIIPTDQDPNYEADMIYSTSQLKAEIKITDNGVHDGVLNVSVKYYFDGQEVEAEKVPVEFINIWPAPDMSLDKRGTYYDQNSDGVMNAGDRINYVFTVKNTGNMTLTDIKVTDANENVVVNDHSIASLAPGATAQSVTGYYVLTQADLDAGTFTNTATAKGKDHKKNPISASDSDTQTFTQAPSMTVSKTSTNTTFTKAGDVLNYTVTVKNTGNVSLNGVVFSDSLQLRPGGIGNLTKTESLDPANNVLQVGETWTYTYSYTVTQEDLDAGKVDNTATVKVNEITDPVTSKLTINATKTASVSLVKAGTYVDSNGDNVANVGDRITYVFTVKNTGNVTLKNVAITDPKATVDSHSIASLAPGASVTLNGYYDLSQEDIDAGSFTNTATVKGKDPQGEDVSGSGTDTRTLAKSASINLDKDGTYVDSNGDNVANVGDRITYVFTVKNTGNVTLKNVAITDPKATVDSHSISSLAPGASVTVNGYYDLSQEDIDAGSFTNTATVKGKDPQGEDVTNEDSDTQTIQKSAGISLSKDGTYVDSNADNVANVGDRITYVFTVENTGNVTLSNINITDANTSVKVDTHTITSLAPGASVTLNGYYELKQEDIDAGSFTNTATAKGKDPQGLDVSGEGTDKQTFAKIATISLSKDGTYVDSNGDNVANVGDRITYVFTVKNTGNVTLKNVAITDPKATVDSHSIASLAPGGAVTVNGYYDLSQADINAGSFTNTATVTSADPQGQTVSASDSDEQTFAKVATVSLIKAGSYEDKNTDGVMNVGDRINYVFTIENTGNVTLSNINITDANTSVKVDTHTITSLAPGGVVTVNGYYELKQEDIDAGSFTNTATAKGKDPQGLDVSGEGTDKQTFAKIATISLSKDGTYVDSNGDNVANVGDRITYVFTVKNTGNVTLKNVAITDPKATVDSHSIASLAPGASVTLNGYYELKQEDIDAGTFTNTATAKGKDPQGEDVTNEDSDTQTIQKSAGISLSKDGTYVDSNADNVANVGDRITYVFTVKNTGNVTLTEVKLTDANPSVKVDTHNITSLAPGASVTVNGYYELKQADIDAGKFKNTATVESFDPDDEVVSASDDDERIFKKEPSMTVTKSTTSTTFNKAGDILNYTVVVKNTGNVTLEDVTVEDSLVTLTNAMRTESISPDGKLEVGETWTYEYTYTVTQADMDKGSVSNAAKAYNPDIPDDPDVPTDDVTITGEQNPAMTVEKSADKTEFSELNEVITYTVKVTNTGNISLKGVVFSDSLANISTPSKTESNAPEDNILQVGEVWTYTYTYKVTQADLDAGKVENTASVKTAEITTPVTDSHTVKGTKLPKMTVNKSVDKDKFTAVGEELKYTVVVTNTGNITLENVTVTDSLVTLTNAMRTESMTDDGKLEVGETWTYKYTYKTTQADMDAGTVTNSAKASNPYIPDDPNNPPPADDNEIPGIQNPAMTVTKNANKTEFTLVGEVITYNVVVENTGNITLKEVKVEDSLVDLSTVTPAESKLQDGKLEVGETWTYYYSYTTTQEDMDAGYVKNSAKATNPNIPDGPDAPADKKDIPGIQNPDMEVRKSADKDKFKEIGEKINYTVVITNTGNITLKDVTVSDSLVSLTNAMRTESKITDGNLQVGETWTYKYTYETTQADMDAGTVTNSAKASNPYIPDDPNNPPPADDNEIPGIQNPDMEVRKSADKDKFKEIGEKINYTVVITNTGNITLKDVTVSDSLVSLTNAMRTESKITDGKLEVGETWTYKYTYKTTQADMDAGTVTNSAKASNPYIPDDPNNPPPADDNEIPGIQNPAMTVTKNANKTEFTLVGEVITYNVVVENTGNITLKEVKVEDSLVDLSTVTPAESKLQDGKLEVGETWTYYYSYTTTQEDMDAGYVKNSAKATNPNIPDGPDAPADKKDIPGIQNPDMEVRKSADKDKFNSVGDVINYTVTITNTGNMKLKDVTVTDSLVKLTDDMRVESMTADGILEVGETWTYTYSHTIILLNLIQGFVQNVVTATNPKFPPNNPPGDRLEIHTDLSTEMLSANVGDCYE